jgi:hypothetical protein
LDFVITVLLIDRVKFAINGIIIITLPSNTLHGNYTSEECFLFSWCVVGVTASLWVLILDYYSIAVGGWAYLNFLVTPEARFAKQN